MANETPELDECEVAHQDPTDGGVARRISVGRPIGARRATVGLVLGAGGMLGGAWLTGALHWIATESGWDPGSTDYVIETSAGSPNPMVRFRMEFGGRRLPRGEPDGVGRVDLSSHGGLGYAHSSDRRGGALRPLDGCRGRNCYTGGISMLGIRAALAATVVVGLIAIVGPATASASYSVPYGGSALGDAIWNETWEPEALEGGNNGCKPSSAHPYPVVLVHATMADEGSNWVTLAPLLANNGYCVYGFNYGATLASFELWPFIGPRIDGLGHIENSAKELSSFVTKVLSKTGASKIDLVGHSQGGMMPNYYVKYLGGASKVNELIGLAPSNHGTTLNGVTEFVEKFPFATELTTDLIEFLGAPSLPEQTEKSSFMTKLFGSGDPVVSGVRYVVIETSHDEVVTPYTHAFLSGSNVTNITIQSQCPSDPVAHIGMFDDSPSLQNVINQLGSSPNPSFKASCTNYGQGI